MDAKSDFPGAGAAPTPGRRVAEGGAELDHNRIKFSWLLHLHWGAVIGQTAAILVVAGFRVIDLPVGTLLGLVALEVAFNFWMLFRLRRPEPVREPALAAVMLFDAAMLTVMLAFSGTYSNPFSILYLVNVALAAVLLRPVWSWVMLGVSLALFGSLFALDQLFHHGFALSELDHLQLMQLHMRGLWVAFATAATFIVYIVSRVSRELEQRERELASERGLSASKDKVASLATLAAGAAHELSTPLATIAVVTRELERSLQRVPGLPAGSHEDLALIRQQLGRCQGILQQMAAHAGENAGETLVTVTLGQWVESALQGLPGRERVVVAGAADLGAHRVEGPARALARALRSLLKNGLQATPGSGPVELRVGVGGGEVRLEVADGGRGMSPEVLARAGEPFFTTKGPGEGMGLGLFLTRALAEQLGGRLELESVAGKGTTARLRLPAALAFKNGGTT